MKLAVSINAYVQELKSRSYSCLNLEGEKSNNTEFVYHTNYGDNSCNMNHTVMKLQNHLVY